MLLDAAHQGKITLEKAVGLMGANGAKRFGLEGRKGAIQLGADADVIVVDLAQQTVVDKTREFSKARECDYFFDGRTFQGRVERTIVNGKTAFVDGRVLGQPGDGRFVRP
jgi:dihydroorotase-like cyclic amidohydrolase